MEPRQPGISSKSEAAMMIVGYLESTAKGRPTVTAAAALQEAFNWLTAEFDYEWEQLDQPPF